MVGADVVGAAAAAGIGKVLASRPEAREQSRAVRRLPSAFITMSSCAGGLIINGFNVLMLLVFSKVLYNEHTLFARKR